MNGRLSVLHPDRFERGQRLTIPMGGRRPSLSSRLWSSLIFQRGLVVTHVDRERGSITCGTYERLSWPARLFLVAFFVLCVWYVVAEWR